MKEWFDYPEHCKLSQPLLPTGGGWWEGIFIQPNPYQGPNAPEWTQRWPRSHSANSSKDQSLQMVLGFSFKREFQSSHTCWCPPQNIHFDILNCQFWFLKIPLQEMRIAFGNVTLKPLLLIQMGGGPMQPGEPANIW